ncbi:amidohydrolase family protein [Aspergillus alliaceus]|uniref:amidohydrolase family protein n=1 Tax=Petromyces alliaceus TaxID=209559 RepID=UPI0012A6E9BA|nr:amidohydrolase 2 [Aspergillus alliaceus]KAB8227030.1 amidohydrolase 2 [Aspergillus alliaceus]
MPPSTSRIDVHHHYLPPIYVEALEAAGGDPSGWKTPEWSLDNDRVLCQKHNIRTAILSVTAPGPDIAEGLEAARIARGCNEWAASLRDQNPQQYGFFATIPSPLKDMNMALSELSYALDQLNADGVTLFTSYGSEGHYLGHDAFRPLWAELGRRKAVVFIHPALGAGTGPRNPVLPAPMIEYPHETTRCAVDLITSRVLQRHPNSKVILSHSGGTLPFIATRPAVLLSHSKLSTMAPEEFLAEARKFYFDVAQSSSEAIQFLLKFAGPERILYGSDFPYCPPETINFFTNALDSSGLTEEQVLKVNVVNASALFSRLQ